MNNSRRGFLLGLGAIVASPAIVRASSLMAIKTLPQNTLLTIEEIIKQAFDALESQDHWIDAMRYGIGARSIMLHNGKIITGLVRPSDFHS